MVAIVDTITVLGIGSAYITIVGMVLKYFFDKRNEKTRYDLEISKIMTDKFHDYVKNHYMQLISQACGMGRYLIKIDKSKTSKVVIKEQYAKYSFFYLARYLSIRETLYGEAGGIFLKSVEAEKRIEFLLKSIDDTVNLNLGEQAILRKYVGPVHGATWRDINVFLDQIVVNKELLEIYEKFKIMLSNEDTLAKLGHSLNAFIELFLFHINLIYEPWYKSKPKKPTEALEMLEKLGYESV